MISSFQRGTRATDLFRRGCRVSRCSQGEVSALERSLNFSTQPPPRPPPSISQSLSPPGHTFPAPPKKKKSIWLCKVQLGPRGVPASEMRGFKGGQGASSGPVPQAVSRTDLRTKGLEQPELTSLSTSRLSLSLSPSWLSGAEEINKQVERLKSPAPEADVSLLRAQQTNTSLRAEQLDGRMDG